MMMLDDSQRKAVDMIAGMPRLAIKTGGPGTGKTTTLMASIATLMEKGVNRYDIALCAPTGKAAKRISQQVNSVYPEAALTIHRLLKFTPFGGWYYNRDNKMDVKMVMVDEASMVDSMLLSRLMDALPSGAGLTLIGDVDQLPPVGAGQPFRDLINRNYAPVARLTTNWRQRNGSLIGHSAAQIMAGKPMAFGQPGKHTLNGPIEDDCFFVEAETNHLIVAEIIKRYKETEGDKVVLVPQKTTVAGVDSLNDMLQKEITGESPDKVFIGPGRFLNPGDPVIHTKNNYSLGVFNGEVGVFAGKDGKDFLVQFPDKDIYYSQAFLSQLQLAYAMTVHKSQGSEYDHVFFVATTSHTYMLSRPLLYTAITRAKRSLHVVGMPEAVSAAIKNTRQAKRNTIIAKED